MTGRVADTNAKWAGAELTRLGYAVVLHLAVDDDAGAIRDALGLAMDRADVVWMTGGLGPTRDDVTVEAVAGALGLGVGEDAATVARIRAAWAKRDQPAPAMAFRMARVPEGSVAFDNPAGTAPGIWIETRGRSVVILPGVPAEMMAIAEASVLPRLGDRVPGPKSCVYRILGVPEGEVDQRVRDLWDGAPAEVRIALEISAGEVLLRVLAPAAWPGLGALDAAIRQRLGEAIYTTEDETLEAHLIRRMKAAGLTVALAESLTGGLVAGRLTSVPGASSVVKAGWVAYSDAAKTRLLGVDRAILSGAGAVSREAAAAMARRAREAAGTDFGVATTGWAGPGGGTPEDPVGTAYFGVAWNGGEAVERRWFRGGRRQVREYAVTFALDLLRRRLTGVSG